MATSGEHGGEGYQSPQDSDVRHDREQKKVAASKQRRYKAEVLQSRGVTKRYDYLNNRLALGPPDVTGENEDYLPITSLQQRMLEQKCYSLLVVFVYCVRLAGGDVLYFGSQVQPLGHALAGVGQVSKETVMVLWSTVEGNKELHESCFVGGSNQRE